MRGYETVDLEALDGGAIVVVHLNRPSALNALSPQLAKDLAAGIRDLGGMEGLRSVVVAGRGRAFSAGGDLAAFHASEDPRGFLHGIAVEYHEAIAGIRRLRAPFVAAIGGACYGAGLALACACDIRFAATDARFCFGFLGVGLSPDSSLPYYLPRIVGIGKAAELAMLNPVIDADEACRIGLVGKVVEPGSLMDDSLAIARRLAAMPTVAIGKLKRLYDTSYSSGLDEHLSAEVECLDETSTTEDFEEGCAAFLGKRKPVFKGR